MHNMRSYPVRAALVLAVGCASSLVRTSGPASPELNREYLTQHWVHSYEEEGASGVEVYRPREHKDLPPSLFRMQYVFKEGGDCEWLYSAPTDGHHFKTGTWHLHADEKAVLRIEQGKRTVGYRVVELAEELLRMTRIDAQQN